ncbi:alpha/beta hydrolase [Coleofasciculus sp. LEGE 07092]|nr:alpha/beta hydrolase [Coleofasciculus sp. LEGE 07081]MBE9148802.1 alpha/beta hydrolase [Coleofasciculus sp. LEGE 07092]
MQKFSLAFGLGILALLSAIPALGAERIKFFYPPFGEFSISVEDLELFAEEGTITDEFAFYANRATPEQLAELREVLQQRFQVSPITISRFTKTPIGETVLERLGRVIKADINQNGFYPLRGALILAAADPEGLTIINILREFPLETIWLDLPLSLQAIQEVSRLFGERDAVIDAIQQQAAEVTPNLPLDFSTQPDLERSGSIRWRQETLTFINPNREEPVPADIYLPIFPNQTQESVPVIVISHGVASNRTTFAYLAQHLASYGFAVAVLEHPDTSAEKFERFLAGFDRPPEPTTFINRPLDIKYLLDELQKQPQFDPVWQGRLNLQQVGVIGQSLGGYTVLAAGGAELNLEQLRQDCAEAAADTLSFNLSLLVQCRATDLPPATYNLQDERIKAVLAINPLSSSIFGEEGLSQIEVPLMIVASGDDVFAPPVSEQIYPFTWLTNSEKYLVVLEEGTHFSFLGGKGEGVFPIPPELIGPDPSLARPLLSALSTAFFKTYLTNQLRYLPYLSQSYVRTISGDSFNLTLVESLTETEIEQAMEQE